MRSAICLLIIFAAFSTTAQNEKPVSKTLRHELELVVENDVFLSLVRDQYYSSGIFGSYRHQLDSAKFPKGVINSARKYSLMQRMYTSYFVELSELEELDRPYAGILSVSGRQDFYLANKQYLGIELELGWMGPGSLTGDIHVAWHDFFGLPDPNGWFSQVNDAPVINLYGNHAFLLIRSGGVVTQADISLESNIALGTVYNYLHERLVMRWGKTLPLHLSTHYGNTLGLAKPSKKSQISMEAYLFYAPGIQFVAYDGTLQGGLINTGESVFTKEPETFRLTHQFGLNLRYGTFDFNFIVYLQPPETDGVTRHSYGGLELRQRF